MSGESFGGIGAAGDVIEAEPVEPAERLVPRRETPDIGDIGPSFRQMLIQQSVTLEKILTDTREYGDRLAQLEQTVAQLSGQNLHIEARLGQFAAWSQQVEARVAAVAKQLVQNTRFAALSLATQSRGPGEPAERVRRNAQEYMMFLEPEDAPEEPATATH